MMRAIAFLGWLGLVLVAQGCVLGNPLIELGLWIGVPAILIVLVVRLVERASERRDAQGAFTLEELDAMSGTDFEDWIAGELEDLGCKLHRTAQSKDFGIDLIAEFGGHRIGIQAKRRSKKVGNSAVREAIAGSDYHDCDLACVITQASFTDAALEQARRSSVPVLLFDRQELQDLSAQFAKGVREEA